MTDSLNHRVQVFTANGKYIRQFGNKGSREGELNEPKGSSDIVYVSEYGNHHISLLEKDTFLDCLVYTARGQDSLRIQLE